MSRAPTCLFAWSADGAARALRDRVTPMPSSPVQVFLSYTPADEPFAHELMVHLAPLVRSGAIAVWDERQVPAGADVRTAHAQRLDAAHLIVLLLSADYLASELYAADMAAAVARHARGEAQVVPILVRPCDWSATALGALQMFPRNGRPVTSWSDREDAWTEVAQGLRLLVKVGAGQRPEGPQAAEPSVARPVRPISDIFCTDGPPDITFVEPAQYKTLRRYLRHMGSGLAVDGPSGVGKTTLVRRVLRDLKAVEQEWLLGQNEEDRQKLDERLSKGFVGHLVIDDFHRLDQPRQARVADGMKMISDRSARTSKITVIGINPVGDSLMSMHRELFGRLDRVRMGRQPNETVAELVQKGEEAANIRFRRRGELILGAEGSLITAQRLCQEAAFLADIDETAPALTTVDVGFADVVEKVIEQLDGKYFSDLRTFACHDERTPPHGAGLALLWLLTQSNEGHVALDDVHFRFTDPSVREALALLKSSYLSKCFEEAPLLRSLFYYNKNGSVLSIEDLQLAFYLRHMSWPRFIERTGHQSARIDAEGKLVFSKRRPSDRPGPEEQAVNVLHLSDLHFTHPQQADVWYGQLAEDLKELECDRLSALVLSGDLTQRAEASEFEAARRFILRLSTELRLSPGQVVVVPGNHDMSWPLSKAAYALHRREDYAGPLEEGKFIEHTPAIIEVRDEALYQRRFVPFAEFYGHIKGKAYALEYEAQLDVQDFARENLLFIGLNSAWETDHYFTSRVSVHAGALSYAIERIRLTPAWAGRLKIAVWHHPLTSPGEDRIKDHGFMQQLAKTGVRLVLHGHVHKAERGLFRYDVTPDGRRIEVVAGGTFGAPTRDWVHGYPLQYNLLRIYKERIVVQTRRREEPNGAWQPDARWLQGRGKGAVDHYEIDLRTADVSTEG